MPSPKMEMQGPWAHNLEHRNELLDACRHEHAALESSLQPKRRHLLRLQSLPCLEVLRKAPPAIAFTSAAPLRLANLVGQLTTHNSLPARLAAMQRNMLPKSSPRTRSPHGPAHHQAIPQHIGLCGRHRHLNEALRETPADSGDANVAQCLVLAAAPGLGRLPRQNNEANETLRVTAAHDAHAQEDRVGTLLSHRPLAGLHQHGAGRVPLRRRPVGVIATSAPYAR